MSQTSKKSIAAAIEHEAEPELTDESNIVQQEVQTEAPRRSKRARTLTEKGKELQKEKTQGLLFRFDVHELWEALIKVTKKSVIKQDPSDILEEHISTVQKELSGLNTFYDDYGRIDSPLYEMCRKMDNCA